MFDSFSSQDKAIIVTAGSIGIPLSLFSDNCLDKLNIKHPLFPHSELHKDVNFPSNMALILSKKKHPLKPIPNLSLDLHAGT